MAWCLMKHRDNFAFAFAFTFTFTFTCFKEWQKL
jgi:hypothetical protein